MLLDDGGWSATLLLWRRCRFDDDDESAAVRGSEAAPGPGALLGGAAAMGTTPFPPTALPLVFPWKLVGVLPADAEPLAGLSMSWTLLARFCTAGGVLAWTGGWLMTVETESVEDFLLMPAEELAVFLVRVLVPPTGRPEPEPRLRFLMTSVFRDNGRTTPWSLRKRPQALHRGWPSGLRRHSGVVWVKQLVHVVGVLLLAVVLALLSPWFPAAACRLVVDPCLETGGGDEGRLVETEEKPVIMFWSGGGEFGLEWVSLSKGAPRLASPGVDAVLGTLPIRPLALRKD
jgi:hypothetical protein